MRERRDLIAHRFHDRRVTLSKVHHRQASEEIEIGFAVGVLQPAPLSTYEGDCVTRIGGAQVLSVQINDILIG